MYCPVRSTPTTMMLKSTDKWISNLEIAWNGDARINWTVIERISMTKGRSGVSEMHVFQFPPDSWIARHIDYAPSISICTIEPPHFHFHPVVGQWFFLSLSLPPKSQSCLWRTLWYLFFVIFLFIRRPLPFFLTFPIRSSGPDLDPRL